MANLKPADFGYGSTYLPQAALKINGVSLGVDVDDLTDVALVVSGLPGEWPTESGAFPAGYQFPLTLSVSSTGYTNLVSAKTKDPVEMTLTLFSGIDSKTQKPKIAGTVTIVEGVVETVGNIAQTFSGPGVSTEAASATASIKVNGGSVQFKTPAGHVSEIGTAS